MPTTAWKSPGTVDQVNNIFGEAWTDPDLSKASDDNYAYSTLKTKFSNQTKALRFRNFGFTTSDVPSGETILGIEVRIERKQTLATAYDHTVKLAHHTTTTDGTDEVGTNQASATIWPTSDGVATYGGATNLWGATLTDTQIRSVNFSVDLNVTQTGSTNNLIYVDHVEMRVHYGSAVSLAPSLLTNSNSFYAPTLALNLSASLFSNAQTFYAAVISQPYPVQPPLLSNSQTFYGSTVSVGLVALQPALHTNAQSFFGPTVAPGPVTLAPSLLTNTNTFYGPTVAPGPALLSPSLLSNAQSFFPPVVSAGSIQLTSPLVSNDNAFFAPTVTPYAFLTPALFANAAAFYAASISRGWGFERDETPSAFEVAEEAPPGWSFVRDTTPGSWAA